MKQLEIYKENNPGIFVRKILRGNITELHIIVMPVAEEDLLDIFKRLYEVLGDAKIVHQIVFAENEVYNKYNKFMEMQSYNFSCPVTWINGCSDINDEIAGIYVFAVEGVEVRTVKLDGKIIGRLYKDDYSEHLFLGDMRSGDSSLSEKDQAGLLFENIKRSLQAVGMDMSNIVRTWFYNKDILAWYDEFNSVRTGFYSEQGIFEELTPTPASTGAGGGNPFGEALISSVFAIQPKDGILNIREVGSPNQGSATKYGSSFSRAVEITLPDFHKVIVSGTASISPDGKTAHLENINKQIELTMNVVNAILESCGLSFSDTIRAIVYLKNKEDIKVFRDYCKNYGLDEMPVLITNNTICRDDLLFEIELDAVAEK